ncbi:MAG: MFS transporter [Micromonosporaceae bacterium]|nr:MFS transporter [Micromonosporaceae bacterium]
MEITTTTRDRRWLGLFAVLAAMIMNILDSTVVNVAAPSIRADLGGSYSTLQWIASAYTLAMAVGLLTGGRLGDMYGRKRLMLGGVAGFVAASAACSLAWSPASLVGARVVQGLCGAILIPQGFGLIRDLFGPRDIGKAFGALGPVIGGATIAGPVVAGLLVDADILGTGWRAVFLINLPLGLFVLAAGAVALPAVQPVRRLRLDITGALCAGTGMVLLVYPLTQGREKGWPGWLLAMLGGAVVVLVGFVGQQLRRGRTGRVPLIELSVFTRRSYVSGVLFVIIFFGSIVGFSLTTGFFLQLGLGYSPMRASLTMSGWAVGAFLGSGFAAAMMGRLGRRILHIGLPLMAAGTAGFILVLTRDGATLTGWQLSIPLAVYGFGMGMIFVPLFDIIMGEVGDHEVGSASGVLESLQQLGASLGVAVLGTVFFSSVGTGRLAGATSAAGGFVSASRLVAIISALTALALCGITFLLPRWARHAMPAGATAQAAPAVAERPELVAV